MPDEVGAGALNKPPSMFISEAAGAGLLFIVGTLAPNVLLFKDPAVMLTLEKCCIDTFEIGWPIMGAATGTAVGAGLL